MHTDGSKRLAKAGTTAAIARALGVSERAVTAWRAGRKLPSDPHRAALQQAFAVPLEAWLQPPQEPVEGQLADLGAVLAALDAEPLPADGTAAPRSLPLPNVGYGRDVIDAAELTRKLLRDLRGPQGEKLDLVTRSKLLGQAAQTLQRLGSRSTDNLAGISREALVSSPSWTALLVLLERALRPWPDALRALAAALQPTA